MAAVAATPYLAAAEACRGEVVGLLRALIATPSMSSDEADVVQRIRQQMEDTGYDEVFLDPFGSIIGRIGNGPGTLGSDSHIDTVDVGNRKEWSRPPFEPYLEGAMDGGI